MAYSESSLTQVGVFLVAPSGGGSVWQSGGAPAVDGSGNIYITTGNGTTYDGTANFIMSILKLSPTLTLLDWYTPSNWSALNSADADFSSGPPFIPVTGLVVAGIKDWNVYSINSSCMGHLGGTVGGCTAPQIFPMPDAGTPGPNSGIFGRMFMNGTGYFPTASGNMYGFTLTGSTWNTTPLFATSATYNTHGIMMTGSSNGASGNLVWGISPNGNNYAAAFPGTLRTLNATTGAELWNSGTNSADNLANTPKFQVPLVANGRVYVGEQNAVAVFGLPLSSSLSGNVRIVGNLTIR